MISAISLDSFRASVILSGGICFTPLDNWQDRACAPSAGTLQAFPGTSFVRPLRWDSPAEAFECASLLMQSV
jgi:hypothetical protein